MPLELVEKPMEALLELATVSIAFEVREVFDISNDGESGEFVLTKRKLEMPYIRNYDLDENQSLPQLLTRPDLTNFGIVLAYLDDRLVGGAVIACRTPAVKFLDGRDDLAILWDMRVAPDVRANGIGSAIFTRVEEMARARGCRELKIETQDINVASCEFYRRSGCSLRQVKYHMYREFPHELQLIWYKDLYRP